MACGPEIPDGETTSVSDTEASGMPARVQSVKRMMRRSMRSSLGSGVARHRVLT
jgi:hypothetical protein